MEPIDNNLQIGDRFRSSLSGATYEVIDLTRDAASNEIRVIRTNNVIKSIFGGVSDGHLWNPLKSGHPRGTFCKVPPEFKPYDPTQQPYTEDDI